MVVGSHPVRREGGRGDLDLIHNFGTHFLCTKSYGILGEKGRGSSISLVHFFGVFLDGFVFPFFLFLKEVSGGGGQRWTYSILSDLKASLKVTLQKV